MSIRYVIPWDDNGNLADAYNREMALGGADYVCFMDGDTQLLDPYFGAKIKKIISLYPGNYFTCITNRIGCKWQRREGNTGDDMRHHRQYSELLWSIHSHTVEDHTDSQLWSGHLMVCPVDKWIPLKRRGILGVDNEIHLNARKHAKVYLMKGIYLYHWYSGSDTTKRDKSHLL